MAGLATRLDAAAVPDLNRLRAKYAPNINASSGGASGAPTPASITMGHARAPRNAGTKADGTEYTPEELAAFHRLDRVKICPACGGQGTQRNHFNHYYVDVDCDKCEGEGHIKLADPAALVAQAQTCKSAAVGLFKAGDFAAADRKFNEGLAFVAQFAATGTPAALMRKSLILNRAACALKLGHWDACIEHCDRLMAQDAQNVKALWRKSQALLGKIGLGEVVEAGKEEKVEDGEVDVTDSANAALRDAKALLRKMLEVEPNHSKALDSLKALPEEVDP